jgi:hypothetical protein
MLKNLLGDEKSASNNAILLIQRGFFSSKKSSRGIWVTLWRSFIHESVKPNVGIDKTPISHTLLRGQAVQTVLQDGAQAICPRLAPVPVALHISATEIDKNLAVRFAQSRAACLNR